MPKVIPNSLLIQIQAISGLVFYRNAEADLIVQQKGERTVPSSVKQLAHNDLFKLASAG